MIAINLSHDLFPNLFITVLQSSLTGRSMEDIPELLLADLPVSISIKHIERYAQILLI